mgnify:FL=1
MEDLETKFRLLQADFGEFKQEFKEFAHKMEQRFESISETMDSIVGDFKKFDEEQTILSHHQSNHSDRIEKLEKKVFGVTHI